MEHGKVAENILAFSCKNIFGREIVFESPNVISAVGKTTEMTDVLILLDDTLITIQSKSLQLSIDEIDDIKLNRIVNKYEDAKRQINRTINARNNKQKVELKTDFKKTLNLPWENIKYIICIIVINIEDNFYTDSEIRFQFPIKYEKHKDYDLHTFILRDFYNIIMDINSGGDFLAYLRERKYLSNKTFQNYTNEMDILALFLTQYEFIEKVHKTEPDIVFLPVGLYEEFVSKNKELIEKRNNKKFALSVVDLITDELKLSFEYTMDLSKVDITQMTSMYFKILGKYSKLLRVHKVAITEKFIEKINSSQIEDLRYFMIPINNIGFLFLISNDRDREIRKSKLQVFTAYLAKYLSTEHQELNINEILAIATEGKKVPGRSIDIILSSSDDALTMVSEFKDISLFNFNNVGRIDEWSM